MEHLKVEINEQYNFKVVTCTEGHHITDWDKQDIKEFTSSTVMYCPLNYDLNNYYCVTDEEYETLMEQHRIAIEEYRTMEQKNFSKKQEIINNVSGTTL